MKPDLVYEKIGNREYQICSICHHTPQHCACDITCENCEDAECLGDCMDYIYEDEFCGDVCCCLSCCEDD